MVELIWEKKYDQSHNKTAPVSVALPFQTIETINESSQQRQKSIESFVSGREGAEWRNRLIWGDKKYVLPSLLPEFANAVDLIYIDPPFDTGADFSYPVEVPDHGEAVASFTKLPSVIEQKAYRDTWGDASTHLDSYLKWFYETLILLSKLLKPTGSIYIHLDWHVAQYAKVIADEVFGRENFRSEIIWQRFLFHSDAKRFGMVHDTLLWYSKCDQYTYVPQYGEWGEKYVKSHFMKDKDGRLYTLDNPTAPGHGSTGKPMRFGGKLLAPPKGTMWRWADQSYVDQMLKEGKIVITSTGRPRVKRYLDEKAGPTVHSIWTDIPGVNSQAKERTGFPTQKPEALLKRIIDASSKPGDLVLDCFCGSGTAAVVAEKTGRRWIACDLSRFAVHTTRKRLLGVENVKPFVI